MVLSIADAVTTPSRTLRALRGPAVVSVAASVAVSVAVSVVSLMSDSALGGSDLALTDGGVDPCDLTADPGDLGGVVELTGGVAEAQVERLVLGCPQLLDELGKIHLGQPAGFGGGACHVESLLR